MIPKVISNLYKVGCSKWCDHSFRWGSWYFKQGYWFFNQFVVISFIGRINIMKNSERLNENLHRQFGVAGTYAAE